MKWVTQGSRHLSPPYQILFSIRGHEAWVKDEKRYQVLGRELSLDQAKEACLKHSLQAEFVK